MRLLKATVTIFILAFLIPAAPLSTAQYMDLGSAPLTVSPADENLHARSLTRFHITTLKAFHTDILSSEENQNTFESADAELLNTALDAFLASSSRASLLLEALRQEKAVRLSFDVETQTSEYRMVKDPTRELLFRFEPEIKLIPVSVEIRPMLDGPVAFEITLFREEETEFYYIDWAGKLIV